MLRKTTCHFWICVRSFFKRIFKKLHASSAANCTISEDILKTSVSQEERLARLIFDRHFVFFYDMIFQQILRTFLYTFYHTYREKKRGTPEQNAQ